jgi:hypothetical protein
MATTKEAQRKERSKRSKGVNCGVFYVVEKMERETRIELATNSLEGCDSAIELLPLLISIIPSSGSDPSLTPPSRWNEGAPDSV